MDGLSAIAVLCWALGAAASLSGQVVDASGSPVAEARVFLESDLASPIRMAQSDGNGRFTFEQVPPGRIGVFAIGAQTAFGGETVTVTAGSQPDELMLQIASPETVSGTVTNHEGEPVSGARITRVAHLGAAKVAVPLAKLGEYGFETPRTDERGRFTVPLVPRGTDVALKIDHPSYATEGVPRVAAGSRNVRVSLHPGVVLSGRVQSREGNEPVPHAGILIRSAEPPHDTTVATTDGDGAFRVRLKPGVYAYQAASASMRSPGWERLVITGDSRQQSIVMRMAGASTLRGEVRNAITREPVSGARLSLLAMGNPADMAQTGPAGTFRLRASEGENVVRLESAPGYRMPEQPALRVQASAGEETELPIFWLLPNPSYSITVVDQHQQPVADAAIRMLRPDQFGWWRADGEGRAELTFASVPADGVVIGLAEHPAEPEGAVFILSDENEAAQVTVLPYGQVRGTVQNEQGQSIEGALVTAVLEDLPDGNPIPLWRTVSRSDGRFAWDAMPAQASVRCMVTDIAGAIGQSELFEAPIGATEELESIRLQGGRSGSSMYGATLRWWSKPVISGDLPGRRTARQEAAVVMFVAPEEVNMVIESVAKIKHFFNAERVRWVVVSDGVPTLDASDDSILVLEGERPMRASTYLIAPGGSVILETEGLPPLAAVRALERIE